MLFTYVIGGFGAWAAALMLLIAVQGDSLNRGGLARSALGFALLGAGMVTSGVAERAARWPLLVLALTAVVGTAVIYRALRPLVGARPVAITRLALEIGVPSLALLLAWFAGPRSFALTFHALCLAVSLGITWTMRRALVAPRNAAEAAVAVTLLVYACSWIVALDAAIRHDGPEHRHLLYVEAPLLAAYAVLYALLPLLVGALVLNLANAQLHYRLRRYADIDELTGLLTRRALLERAAAWQADVLARGRLPAVLLLDVDHFKPINDTHGHERGDEVLRAVSGRLRGTLRTGTALARWGGEEFLVLLDASDMEEAGAAAERMRSAVGGTPFRFGESRLSVTASIGVAAWAAGDDFTNAVAEADTALYSAKRAGRDQAHVAEPA
ncbi:GGDEF domain-containing protein [Luteimonas sp. MC1895]|uniref:GGDEF domain-containing protein n=1 Tax=Luteimonas sp. MC1895 TaxID=2819513 RepID=UPI0018F0AC89|nr:GGDEF domain-containing protein [Luteimonas sp. MC1895]MBJ6979418.1 GGDEF domain-containing protein [Luteimonas sp. MC1895]